MKLVKRGKEKSKALALAPVAAAWPAFSGLRRLQNDIDRLFEEPFGGWLAPASGFFDRWGPVVNVYEDKNNVVVKVETGS